MAEQKSKLYHGDCLKVMRELPSGQADEIVTDPPYGYSFMGKNWDRAVPSVAIWRECLRILKPGGFAFIMSSPRADVLSQMIVRIGSAGFRTDFSCIYWSFASGFPKAMNVSLMVDKQECMRQLAAKLGRKPVKAEFVDAWKNFRPQVGFDEAKFKKIANSPPLKPEHGFNQNSMTAEGACRITEPRTEAAKRLNGAYGGFQPKPAVEVIIVAMKPLSEKTFVDQALKNGKGVTWFDDARVPFADAADMEQSHDNALGPAERFKTSHRIYDGGRQSAGFGDTFNEGGRFPANLLVSDDALNDGVDRKSGSVNIDTVQYHVPKTNGVYGEFQSQTTPSGQISYGDSGSFSRFFSLDLWFEKQFKKLPAEVQKTFPFLIEPKASQEERNRNLKEKNSHCTVKPLQLMSYLITIGSRPNDLVVDPFLGSGTTCLAAKMLGRRYAGIEISKEYFTLAEIRVGSHRTLEEFNAAD